MLVRPAKVLIPATAELLSTRYIGEGVWMVGVMLYHNSGTSSCFVAVKAPAPLTRQELFDTVIKQMTGT